MTDTQTKKLSLIEQYDLDSCLINAAQSGDAERVQRLLTKGADVHVSGEAAMDLAAYNGHTETVRVLLAGGADIHAWNYFSLKQAIVNDHMETVQLMATHIFAPDSWRGKNRAEIEAKGNDIYSKVSILAQTEHVRRAASIILDCALTCWEQVRPPSPSLTISPIPAKPRPL